MGDNWEVMTVVGGNRFLDCQVVSGSIFFEKNNTQASKRNRFVSEFFDIVMKLALIRPGFCCVMRGVVILGVWNAWDNISPPLILSSKTIG